MSFQTRNIRQSQKKKELKNTATSLFQKLIRAFSSGARKTSQFAKDRLAFIEQRQKKKRRLRWLIGIIGIIFGFFVVIETSDRVIRFFEVFEFKDLVWLAGSDLPVDEYGHTNLLLLGVGGDTHSGGGHTLTDTVMIGSIDHESQTIVMLSIPRDFYVDIPITNGGRINEVIRDVMNQYKIEEKDEGYNKGVAMLKDKITEVTGLTIHRYAQIDFSGFEEGVDALGGIDVVVEKAIDDYTYPTSDGNVEHFYLPTGPQHLDGKTALKYVRSRHGQGNSDFARAQRQRKLIAAIQEKAISKEILTSPKKMKELYTTFEKNIKTDLVWREMISLGNVGFKFPRENIFSFGLNNDESKPGGFLVTPDRDLYGGAFVLVPFFNLKNDKYQRIRILADNIFRKRFFHLQTLPISILNGTGVPGLAGKTTEHVERFGITVAEVENSEEKLKETEIRFPDTPEGEEVALQLQRYFSAILKPQVIPAIENPNLEITVIVGQDHENYRTPKQIGVDVSSSPVE